MEDNIEKPYITQISNMVDRMSTDKNLQMFDWDDNAFTRLERMTMKQYKYGQYLWITGKNHQLKQLLSSFLKLKIWKMYYKN